MSAISRSSKNSLLVAELAAAILVACGGDDTGPAIKCRQDADCPSSHTCTDGLCACDAAKCTGLCMSNVCRRTSCSSANNRCGRPGYDLCDPIADECYPENGLCEEDDDCPTFGGVVTAYGPTRCGPRDTFCHALPPQSERVVSFEDTQSLPIVPIPDHRFADSTAVHFDWPRSQLTVIASVLAKRLPIFAPDVGDAIWAAFLGTGSAGVSWSEGATPDGAVWRRPPDPLPETPLYFVAVGYAGSQVVAISDLIPFRVTSEWPALGELCARDSECWTPQDVRACYEGRCVRPCLSHVDCANLGDGRCGPPMLNAARYCGVRKPEDDGGTVDALGR
jgi:hypothetical protein